MIPQEQHSNEAPGPQGGTWFSPWYISIWLDNPEGVCWCTGTYPPGTMLTGYAACPDCGMPRYVIETSDTLTTLLTGHAGTCPWFASVLRDEEAA